MTDIVERLRTFLGNGIGEDAAKEIESLRQQLAESQTKLIECQAREKVLQDTMSTVIGNCILGLHNGRPTYHITLNAFATIVDALALPSDSTALDSAIKQTKREALLEAAKSFTCKTYGLMPHDLRSMADKLK